MKTHIAMVLSQDHIKAMGNVLGSMVCVILEILMIYVSKVAPFFIVRKSLEVGNNESLLSDQL